jgi:hypothetical protein
VLNYVFLNKNKIINILKNTLIELHECVRVFNIKASNC